MQAGAILFYRRHQLLVYVPSQRQLRKDRIAGTGLLRLGDAQRPLHARGIVRRQPGAPDFGMISQKALGHGVALDMLAGHRVNGLIEHRRLEMNMLEKLRSEEHSVGKECVSTCRSRWAQYHKKKKKKKK